MPDASTAVADVVHRPEPDGYCTTCQTVPCRQPKAAVSSKQQDDRALVRIEAKLNKLLRHFGLQDDD